MPSPLSCDALDGGALEHASVELRSAASVDSLPVLRSVASTMAIDADFDVDRIEDTRLLIDELCSTLVRSAEPRTILTCRFRLDGQRLHIVASLPIRAPTEPDRGRFGWRVLVTLADTIQTWCEQPQAAEYAGSAQWQLHIETTISQSRNR